MDKSIVMLGGSGAVGTEVIKALIKEKEISGISLLGRTPVEDINSSAIHNYKVDILNPTTYENLVKGYDVAICTLGVGQPSKVSKEDFIKIDKNAVIDFAKACKKGGIKHFLLLSSVGSNANSSSYYLKSKGELIEELKILNFERLSIFQPSMILTPTNRYGLSQAIVLAVWPVISLFFIGGLKKYRGIKVEDLGAAMAKKSLAEDNGFFIYDWKDF